MKNTKESGMILIISLVVLLILTILGTAAMKTTVVEERLTGFTLSKQISFDSSEAALRTGESAADNLPLGSSFGVSGLFAPNPASPVWLDTSLLASWVTLTAGTITGVNQQPSYIMELTGAVPRDDNCALDVDASANQDCWRYNYRVTAQGSGLNTQTNSMVQSTILSRK